MSQDSKILKLWERDTVSAWRCAWQPYNKINYNYVILQGKPFTSIEPGVGLNDLCIVPDTGLLFMANEAPKMQTYYIPVSRWCHILHQFDR